MGDRNVLGFLKEFGLNLVDPQRQEFRRDKQLIQLQEMLRSQSLATRGTAINEASINVAEIKAKQDRQEALLKLLADVSQPATIREEAGLQAGFPVEAFPRFEGLGPRAVDPAGFLPPVTAVQQGLIDLQGSQGRQALGAAEKSLADARVARPRAFAAGDPFPQDSAQTLEQLTRAVGGLREAPLESDTAQIRALIELNKALFGTTKTTSPIFEGLLPTTTVTEGIPSPALEAIGGRLAGELGFTPEPVFGPIAPAPVGGLPSQRRTTTGKSLQEIFDELDENATSGK